VCGDPITEARLKAIPTARQCVPCLEQAGDVPRLRRLDEVTNEGTVETYFIENPYISSSLRRCLTVPPSRDIIARLLADDTSADKYDAIALKMGTETEEEMLRELALIDLPFWSKEDFEMNFRPTENPETFTTGLEGV